MRNRWKWPRLLVIAILSFSALPALAQDTTSNVRITKVDTNGAVIEGAEFTLFKDNPPTGGTRGPEDTAVGTCTTNDEGTCEMAAPFGPHWLAETKVPNGFSPIEDHPLTIKAGRDETFSAVDEPTPAQVRVNDPTGDANIGDTTHIFQFGPSVAVGPGQNPPVFMAYTDSTGFADQNNPSATSTAFSINGGQTFVDNGALPTGGSNRRLLGDPVALYDPVGNRWIVASIFCEVTGGGVERCPIGISTSADGTTFDPPVSTWPQMDVFPAFAHGAELAAGLPGSPLAGHLFMSFTLSRQNQGGSIFLTKSSDGGNTWTDPIPISGSADSDFSDIVVAPNGEIYVSWANFPAGQPNVFDINFTTSSDQGATFSSPTTVVAGEPQSGDEVNCSGAQTPVIRNVYEGFIAAQDAPEVAVDEEGNAFFTWSRHGAGSDRSDIMYSYLPSGSQTWTDPMPVGPLQGAQFYPSIGVSANGTVGIAYYDQSLASPSYDTFIDFFYSGVPVERQRVSSQSSTVPKLSPQHYDTHLNECNGIEPFDIGFPGSGAFVAWTDTRDPGPGPNNGVDPNIYFARVAEPPAPTTTTLAIDKTNKKITASGRVNNGAPGGPMTVTLSRKDRDKFKKVASRNVALNPEGFYAAFFNRPDGGKCRVKATYLGDEEHEPSEKTKTFSC